MNWETVENEWEQTKDKVKERWDKLTHEDLDTIKGKKDQLIDKIKEYYGITLEEADKQLQNFLEIFSSKKEGIITPKAKDCDSCNNDDEAK